MDKKSNKKNIMLNNVVNIMNELEKFFIDISKDHIGRESLDSYSIKTYIDVPHNFLYTVEICNSQTKTIVIKQIPFQELLFDCSKNKISEKWNFIIMKMIIKSNEKAYEDLTKIELDF